MNAKNLICAAVLALPMAASAESLSYRYVDVAHFPEAEIDANGLDVDGDGIQLRGSLPVYQNIFALAELAELDLDNGVDATRLMVGAGGHWPIGNNLDLIARAGVVTYEVDFGRFDDDDTGLFAGVRLRTFVAPKIEVEGGVEHVAVDVAGIDSDTYLIGEGRYNFTPQFSAGLLITLGGDTSVFGAQGRFSF
ncbi:outer membrane beta-barrel protein [Steroidobacter sp.]|uniref:outer membrane beta-barrel protein n=1 Tax=Steroidobacter sp. TaxID=1978227 RepID=UPI002ED99C6B